MKEAGIITVTWDNFEEDEFVMSVIEDDTVINMIVGDEAKNIIDRLLTINES